MVENRFIIPTTTGHASEADVFMQLIEHIRLAEEACYVLAHINTYEKTPLKHKGYLAMGEMFKMTAINVTNLATGKIRRQAGFR